MLFELKYEEAQELAAVADACANRNQNRPILEAVCLEVDQTDTGDEVVTWIRAIATDTYTLAKREVKLSGMVVHDDFDEDFIVEAGERTDSSPGPNIMVDGRDFKKAIKDSITGGGGPSTKLLISLGPEEIVVTHRFENSPEVTLKTSKAGTFPQWRKLMGGRFEDYEGGLPAFDPVKLSKLATLVSTKPSDRATRPFRMAATVNGGGTKDPRLSPWLFTVKRAEDSLLEVILMPTRI